MDERLWFTGTDPHALLADLYPMHTLGSERPQSRQSRMYLLACARRAWGRLPGACRALVELAEVYTESPTEGNWLRGLVAPIAEQLMHSEGEPSDLAAAHADLGRVDHPAVEPALRAAGAAPAAPAPGEWQGLIRLVYLPFVKCTPTYKWVPGRLHSVRLLREVYGNPCRYTPFDPAWRTDTAVMLARQMYEAREFSSMPILADALQDAGCDCDDILNHCRDKSRRHVRGCWVVDQVLSLK